MHISPFCVYSLVGNLGQCIKGNILEPPAAQSYSQCVVNEKSMACFTIAALWNILGSLREISTLDVLGVPIIC